MSNASIIVKVADEGESWRIRRMLEDVGGTDAGIRCNQCS